MWLGVVTCPALAGFVMRGTDVDSIRARHKNARPNRQENPAFAHAEQDLGWLLEHYDRLNDKYVNLCAVLNEDRASPDSSR